MTIDPKIVGGPDLILGALRPTPLRAARSPPHREADGGRQRRMQPANALLRRRDRGHLNACLIRETGR